MWDQNLYGVGIINGISIDICIRVVSGSQKQDVS